jgi:hypothetical protein
MYSKRLFEIAHSPYGLSQFSQTFVWVAFWCNGHLSPNRHELKPLPQASLEGRLEVVFVAALNRQEKP